MTPASNHDDEIYGINSGPWSLMLPPWPRRQECDDPSNGKDGPGSWVETRYDRYSEHARSRKTPRGMYNEVSGAGEGAAVLCAKMRRSVVVYL
jgi:hypothetical protein